MNNQIVYFFQLQTFLYCCRLYILYSHKERGREFIPKIKKKIENYTRSNIKMSKMGDLIVPKLFHIFNSPIFFPSILCISKLYFIIDQQIARRFVHYSECVSNPPSLLYIQLKQSTLFTIKNRDFSNLKSLYSLMFLQCRISFIGHLITILNKIINYQTISANDISAPRIQNNFWCIIKLFIFSNYRLFSIAPNIVIVLPPLQIAIVTIFSLLRRKRKEKENLLLSTLRLIKIQLSQQLYRDIKNKEKKIICTKNEENDKERGIEKV